MMYNTVEREVIRKDLLFDLRWARSSKSNHVSISARGLYPTAGYRHAMMLVYDTDGNWNRVPVSLHESIDLGKLFGDVMIQFKTRDPVMCQVHRGSGENVLIDNVSISDTIESIGLENEDTLALVFL